MKILLTGATGFLGPWVLERLLARGETDVRCLVRPASNRARIEAIAARHPQASLELVVGNLGEPEALAKAVDGVAVIYHLAAALTGRTADIFLTTVVGSKNLLEAIKGRNDLRIVLVSSFAVYGVANLRRGSVVNEETPLDPLPEKRDAYSHSKLRQEQLFREYQKAAGFDLVIVRPGVVYGPGGSAFSVRVGVSVGNLFLHLGGRNLLPITYVENCAEAIAVAGQAGEARAGVYNVCDDELITARAYLRMYKTSVKKIRSLPIPYPAALALSWCVERYSRFSKGQLPAALTPYKTRTAWKPTRFDNSRLRALGWKQLVPTAEGLRRNFEWLRAREEAKKINHG